MSRSVWAFVGMMSVGLGWAAVPGTLQLKDQAAITGTILAEKPDQIVVDVGYTVLVVPRSHVVEILRRADFAASGPEAAEEASSAPAIYHVAASPPSEGDVRSLVKRLGEAVVQVRTPGSLGSGFVLNQEGYLITNFHVVEGDTQISVEAYLERGGQLERKLYKDIRIVALNKFADLALLKIEDETARRFVHVTLGDFDQLGVGDRVFAIGSPLGLERTVTEGIVSTKTREIQGELYLQTTAPINPGNSGGPLFNLRGQVVGVTNMKITAGEGLGFAIPVEAVKFFLNHRDAFAYDSDNPNSPFRYLPPPRRTGTSRPERAEPECSVRAKSAP